jgi:hypothetical protein
LLARGLAAALALVVCGGAVDWGHQGGDDADCRIALSQHDHNAHRFHSAPANQQPPAGHCYICHSLQVLHSALKERAGQAAGDPRSTEYRVADELLARSVSGLARSSRAPPAVSL